MGPVAGSTGVVFRNSCGNHWLVSSTWRPNQYSKPRAAGQRSNGSVGEASQSGVLRHVPKAAVEQAWSSWISAMVAEERGQIELYPE
ncbi:hypothetical protein P2H44_01700 [Albimonas sp. CAU 1670]|uniref:hypothetical protein n=1 Tax=Albimonas sp. CAU 1670 TaxID=3032599 RepID=UPI0023DA971B|nr:hypothetical protein [Albimonas sp. CAU 1670]MDF2231260.1 hypothetical protein [Albimonas sp. CAU 1670]